MSTTIFCDKTIFVAGGSGTWGNELTSQLLDLDAKEIRIFSRGEISQVAMKNKFANKRVKFIIGDVRDFKAVKYAMQGSDYVFNLAALKHVGICEEQPQEAIKTNIDGTINLIQAAIELKVKKFAFASTDKAIYASNLYGMTKGVCERLIIQANALTNDTDFVLTRSGNIMGSSGSVIPLFRKMAEEKNKITVTDGSMTRFFLPVQQVANLMLIAMTNGWGGEIFIPDAPAFYIGDLAKVMIEHYGKPGYEITEVGSRPGEKLHEMLISPHEPGYTRVFSGNILVILPSIDVNRTYEYLNGNSGVDFEQLSSEDRVGDATEFHKLLHNNGFLA